MVNRLILASIFVIAAGPAAGQVTGESTGRVTAFACESLPSPLRVGVEVSDEPLQADRLRRILVRSLGAHQAIVTPGAPFQLNLYINLVRQTETHDPKTKFRIPLWSNRRDSLFGGQRYELDAAQVNEIRVEITVDNLTNSHCVWQGEAVPGLDDRDEQATAEQMIPLLVDRLGRSARAEPFALR